MDTLRIPGAYEGMLDQARQARAAGHAEVATWLYQRVIDRVKTALPRAGGQKEQLMEYLTSAADEFQAVLDWMGDHARAIGLCDEMVELDPEHATLWQRRAATERIYAGDVEQGIADLRRLCEEEPDEFWHPLELAARLLELDRLDEAEETLMGAELRARDDEERGLVYWMWFRVRRAQGRLREAAQAWETACRYDDFYKQSAGAVYRMFIAAGDYLNAEVYLEREQNSLMAGYYRGVLAYRQGQKSRAQRAWRQVAQKPPGDFDRGWEHWAMALVRLGDKDTALKLLENLTDQGYATDQGYTVAALAWASVGDLETTKANLDLALRTRRQIFGPRALLPFDSWLEFKDVVQDEELLQKLQEHFDLGDEDAEADTEGDEAA
ncbi:MAG: hypothetical protein J7M34_05080 [Anaerolineae bacterium]|nr:hypothetical protein [Anaerolineae bacterium]